MEISQASAKHIPELRHLYAEFLKERDNQDYRLLPGKQTVDGMFGLMFVPAIIEKRGVFVAVEDEKVVGALFWITVKDPFPTRFSEVLGYGQYSLPEYRGKGVIKQLMDYGRQHMREKCGQGVVVDSCWNGDPGPLRAATGAGFKPSQTFVELPLVD